MDEPTIWMVVGFVGQGLFASSFLVQWVHSERSKRSIVPNAFWYFRLLGGATLLAYALFRLDPVFIVGQFGGLFVYSRNIQLLFRERRAAATGG